MVGNGMVDTVGPRADSVGANFVSLHHDTEGQMLDEGRWQELHRLRAQGQSISALARQMEMDRRTVRRWLNQPQWTPYPRRGAKNTKLSAHRAWLIERAPQVNYSAQILYQELRAQRGYLGGYDTVKLAVRPLRRESQFASLTQCRFETAPGQQAQVDWGEVKTRFEVGVRKIRIFVMTLGYSRRAYVEGFEDERMGSLLAAHERAFEYFGGRCAELLYDRMRTVTIGEQAGKPRWNSTFEAFAQHWGFEPRLCRARRAQTKGKVESGVKYVKRNFMPGRVFRDMEDFNEQLRQWSQTISDLRVHGTTHQRPIDRFQQAEAAALGAITGQGSFMQAMVRERVVAEDWLVSIDTNRYSVPCRLIGKTVQVVRNGGVWQIRYRGQSVAEHAVLSGRHQLSVHPEHSPGASARQARKRFSQPNETHHPTTAMAPVEIRDLHIYEQILEAA